MPLVVGELNDGYVISLQPLNPIPPEKDQAPTHPFIAGVPHDFGPYTRQLCE
jgi:hypothetical protein